MKAQEYWNDIGSKKDFEDPLYIEKLAPFLNEHSQIIEVGCGYGRILQILKSHGYKNLVGFDFAPKMIERGLKEDKTLPLRLLDHKEKIPCEDQSVDAVIMSTILCCIIDKKKQIQLIDEVYRVLCKGGGFYLSDFMICEQSEEKYRKGFQEWEEWGVYTSSENLTVRYHSSDWIMDLLKKFDIQWFEQTDFKTMNHNPARTFHSVSIRSSY